MDRGSFSVEVILTLLAFKLLYPQHMHLTRGNHETDDMNKMYGFQGEAKAKYGEKAYEVFKEVFCALPLVAVIGEKVMVVHGGLPSDDKATLADIRKIDRYIQPHGENLMTDLLWSDPQPMVHYPILFLQAHCNNFVFAFLLFFSLEGPQARGVSARSSAPTSRRHF